MVQAARKKMIHQTPKEEEACFFSQVSVVTALDLLGFGITLCCLQFFDKLLFG